MSGNKMHVYLHLSITSLLHHLFPHLSIAADLTLSWIALWCPQQIPLKDITKASRQLPAQKGGSN
jgi:hypothetical protein